MPPLDGAHEQRRQFVLTTADGRTLRSADLQGATLKIGAGGNAIEVTINSVEEDPRAVGGRVLLHHFVVKESSGRIADLCAPDAQGRTDRALAMTFEAACGAEGAICVARPSIPENISLEQLGDRYPHLKAHLGPTACTEESAMHDPRALLFNRSWQ